MNESEDQRREDRVQPFVRQYCLYCDSPKASDKEWETIPEGEGNDLCWGECHISAEEALERVSRERDSLTARLEQLQRAAMAVMEWYFRDGSVGGAEDPMYELMKSCGVTKEVISAASKTNSNNHPPDQQPA